MRAMINGVTVEGTPQEIMEYRRLVEVKVQEKPINITVNEFKGRCPNEGHPCYCTGACMDYRGTTSYDLRKKKDHNKYELERRGF